jgi:hypothetical protein
MWGVFRVARRAYPLSADLQSCGPGEATFKGAHDGYARFSSQVVHKREIRYRMPGTWLVHDRIEGRGFHTIDSFLHIHPAFSVARLGRTVEVKNLAGQVVLTITPDPAVNVAIEHGSYFPEFGKDLSNPTLIMSYKGDVPVTLTCLMTKTLQTIP